MNADRAAAERRDTEDPLGPFVHEFVIADRALAYLDGNSLGRLPRRTVRALDRAVYEGWGCGLVGGWDDWIDLPVRVGDRLGRAVLGSTEGQVVVCDSTTVNLFKLVSAAVSDRPGRRVVVTDDGNFPTDRYVLEGIAAQRGLEVRWVSSDPVYGVSVAAVETAMDGDVALAMFSAVDYRSAAVSDVEAITGAVHACGALALWDLSHAAGAVPVDLDGWGVDLAVGCSYKYLNGGPGAPAWLYVRRELQGPLTPAVWGWFGQEDQFAMGPGYRPAAGMRRWLAGTPSVLGIVAVEEGIALVEEAGMDRIRAKGSALTAYAAELIVDANLPGVSLASPENPSRRGSHLALRHPQARQLTGQLLTAGVVTDFREPDVLRLGLSPLTTRFAEVWDGVDRLRRVMRA